MTGEEYVGTKVVAAFHNVTTTTVRRWAHAGRLKADRPGPRGRMRFRWADVEAFRRPVAANLGGAA